MKSALDIVAAATLLVLLSPLLVILAVAVWVSLGRPVFFSQERVGRQGRVFRIVKFRTMLDGYAANGERLPDAERLTRFGQCLRRTSLDELPELWNVLCGEMSLVGPRPLLVDYLPHYTPRQAQRHLVRPGITGWAQVNGRNTLDWPTRLEMDVWYVENRSLWLDLKILAMTVSKVLRREGVSAEGHATMPRLDQDQPSAPGK